MGYQKSSLIVIKRLALCAAALVCATLGGPTVGSAKSLIDDATKPVHNMTVAVSAHFGESLPKHGFGLIVGIDQRLVHVVVPNHVVRKETDPGIWIDAESVILQFFQKAHLSVMASVLEYTDYSSDFTFLQAEVPYQLDMELQKLLAHARMYRRNAPVWYVGKWEDNVCDWYMPGISEAGTLTQPNRGARLIATGLTIRPGRSGAPLFVDSGVVGIIVETSDAAFYAQPIDQIKSFAKKIPAVLFELDDYEWFSFAPKWYVGLGAGVGKITVSGTLYDTIWYDEYDYEEVEQSFKLSEFGPSASFRIARGFKNNLLVGFNTDVIWFRETDETDSTYQFYFGNMSASLTYYFSNSFYVRGGPSLSLATVHVNGEEKEEDEQNGLGFAVGAGGQFRIGKKWAFNPTATYAYQHFADFDTKVLSLTAAFLYLW